MHQLNPDLSELQVPWSGKSLTCYTCKTYCGDTMWNLNWVVISSKKNWGYNSGTNYYSIEILHGVTAISLTYHLHHAKLQVLPMLHLHRVILATWSWPGQTIVLSINKNNHSAAKGGQVSYTNCATFSFLSEDEDWITREGERQTWYHIV